MSTISSRDILAANRHDRRLVGTGDQVTEPAALRYAWADNPTCDLTNSSGLPAAPFRTDDWAAQRLSPRKSR